MLVSFALCIFAVGLIDAGYRGELMAAVDNIKSEPFTVKKGDRLFQAVAFNGEGFKLEVRDILPCINAACCVAPQRLSSSS